MPSGSGARLRKEKAEKAREEAEKADKEEGNKRTISFGAGNSNTKTATPMKSALRKGPKESIKVFKHKLVADVRVRVNCTKKKNKVSKQVCNCLEGGLDFIRKTLLEGKMEVAFLGKEGRKSKKKHQNDVRFPIYSFLLCLSMGMNVEIEPLLEEWRMDLSERGIEIRKKLSQPVHACDKWITLGFPTGVPTPIVERQLMKSFIETEDRVRKDEHGLYDQGHHATKEPLKFALVKKFTKCRGCQSKAMKGKKH